MLGDLNGLKQVIVRILFLVQIPAHFVQIKCQLLALTLLCPQFRLKLANQCLINALFLLILIFWGIFSLELGFVEVGGLFE